MDRVWLSIPYLLYYAHALTSWGNRMWKFAVGLFLVNISKSLRLTAIYGFTSSATIFIIGASLGHWIDKNQRFRVAKIALFGQNGFLAVCFMLFALSFWHQKVAQGQGSNSTTIQHTFMVGVIITAVLADIAALVSKIVIDSDWVAVIAREEKRNLASMNATLKRIDLLCNILTPLLVGQIMSFVTLITGACFVAGWNIVSAFLEYMLIAKIYSSVPRLAVKLDHSLQQQVQEEREGVSQLLNNTQQTSLLVENPENKLNRPGKTEGDAITTTQPLLKQDNSVDAKIEATKVDNEKMQINGQLPPNVNELAPLEFAVTANTAARRSFFESFKNQILKQFRGVVDGWKLYMGQKIKYAGLSFSLLYLTVLGFDSITVGYAYSLNVSEGVIGAMIALGAVTGLAGTLFYPKCRNRFGSNKTGILSLSLQIACLSLCVFSLWLPGSPWTPAQRSQNFYSKLLSPRSNGSNLEIISSLDPEVESPNLYPSIKKHHSISLNGNSSVTTIYNSSTNSTKIGSALINLRSKLKSNYKYWHIGIFLFGIVASRIGLWMIDLNINQIIQESVIESQKGIIGGILRSLTMIFEIVKYSTVILLPNPQTYGWLVIGSFAAIIFSLICFMRYAFQTTHANLYDTHHENAAAISSLYIQSSSRPGNHRYIDTFRSSCRSLLRNSRNKLSPRDAAIKQRDHVNFNVPKDSLSEQKANENESQASKPVYNTQMTMLATEA